MDYNDILRIYPAINELSLIKLPAKKAWQLWKITGSVRERYEFYCQEEMKLAAKYAVCTEGRPIVTSDGQITFSTEESRKAYKADVAELKGCDACFSDEMLEITSSELGDQMISSDMIDRLRGVVNFIFITKED